MYVQASRPKSAAPFFFEIAVMNSRSPASILVPVGRLRSTVSQRGIMSRNEQARITIFTLGVLSALIAFAPMANAACGEISGQPTRQVFSDGATLATCLDGDNWTSIATGGSPGGATGHVQFNNSGAFAGDAGLFWDNTNKRLGIGTTSPATKLDVVGTIRSNTGLEVTNADAQIRLWGSSPAAQKWAIGSSGDASDSFLVYDLEAENPRFWINDTSGNVGIGTTSPSEKLDVAGTIKATAFALDIQYVSATGTAHASAPSASVTCPANYKIIGGGCQSVCCGSYTIASFPSGENTWNCSHGHNYGVPYTATAYGICVRTQ